MAQQLVSVDSAVADVEVAIKDTMREIAEAKAIKDMNEVARLGRREEQLREDKRQLRASRQQLQDKENALLLDLTRSLSSASSGATARGPPQTACEGHWAPVRAAAAPQNPSACTSAPAFTAGRGPQPLTSAPRAQRRTRGGC